MTLYTGMFPINEWADPCDLICNRCGWKARVETCEQGRREAQAHDAKHWAEDLAAGAKSAGWITADVEGNDPMFDGAKGRKSS